jgi:hypothetical protein
MNAVEVNARVGGELGVGPIQGGVQQLGALLDSEERFSPEKDASAVQQSSPLLDELDGNQNSRPSAGALIPAERRTAGEDVAPATSMGLPAISPFTKAGRKAVITPQVAEQICMLLSVGFSRRQAANYLGFSPMTITNAATRDSEFAADLRRAEEISDIHPELTLMAAARKNWRAAAWYLSFKAKNPRPKTEEEKQAEHQDRLEDQRRSNELTRSFMLGFEDSRRARTAASDAADMRGFDPVTGAPLPERPRKGARKKSS